MTDSERSIVDLAVTVLREVVEAPAKEQRPSMAIRFALRVFLPHCPERWPLTQFWTGINGTHEIGRAQTVIASFSGFVAQRHKSGAYAEVRK